ncbi:hypothetical protein HJC23_006443 [Cyclotella cryptica]|uniref:UBA domain-containing protein n=1 Tax=Cyclotella cryptica TaxID=29204 RepID=A0ABD3QV28_9STRA|eukprot:CCRYP_001854-RA/>CCRYP_001854-RA protein AED:0.01 eAED:0.01 QI:357/1/1/1/1/1/2/1421/1494
MGKKRRPPTKSSGVLPAPSAPQQPTASSRPAYDTSSNSGNPGASANAALNGISLPPAIANQILAAMSRSSSANSSNNGTGSNDANGMSKQYLDEMGRMIAAHMNSAVASGSYGGSVRFSSGQQQQHQGQGQSENTHSNKAVFGPALPPTGGEFNNQGWCASGAEYDCFVKGGKKKASSSSTATTGGQPTMPIDTANFQNIQQLFTMAAAAAGSSGTANNAGSTFSFTSGKIHGKATKHNYNSNNPEDVKTMMNLFSELIGMSSHASSQHQSTSTSSSGPSNEELAREFYEKFIASDSSTQQQAMLHSTDPLALRKAAFAAGVNVAMQQQMMRDEIQGRERAENKAKSTKTAGGSNTNVPVFSMIFGQGGGNAASDAPTHGAIPPLPPPSNGWPTGAPAAAAAAAAAAFASSLGISSKDAETANTGVPSQYYNSPDFAGALSSSELGSPAWLEYYFEEYARNHNNRNSNLPQDRPDPPASKADCPAHFEYGDDEDYEEEEERLMEERHTILQAQEEERKAKVASKKRDKKARKKERAKKEAEAKAAVAAKKKREKAITSWRSRVVAACTSSDISKMDLLLSESPYKNYIYDADEYDFDEEDDEGYTPRTQEEYLIRQLDWFLPNCLQKYPELELGKVPFENNEAREKLAKYIMNQSFDAVCIPGPNMLRNALHTAAYRNDENFVKWIIEGQKDALARCNDYDDGTMENPFADCLDALCDDAGWTPLHYATAAGSEGVVEMLLEAGCNIRARSDYELTCLNSSGYGITARELATVLQSGAIHEDLSCDGDVLDEIIETRIVCASTIEKNAYMRVLRSLTERLEDVEINGYSPLRKTGEQNKSASKASPGKAESQATGTNSKKSKKKKKKQQQQQQHQHQTTSLTPSSNSNNVTETKIESKPAPPDSPEEDLTDPVAVALLGMGFTAEQITNAAKALGGFDRATADDMVMWILSGGELNNEEQDNSTEDNADADNDDSNNSDHVITKAQSKSATKAQRDAEDLARKRQEELAAAERAAAKREEQRRIRREWNEREQARQEVEKNAKIAQVVEKTKQAELQKIQAEMASKTPPLPVIPPTVHVGGGKGKAKSAQGPPQTIVAGPVHGGKKPAPSVSNMGIPKGPNVKAPKILARPPNAPPGTLPQTTSQTAASSQPLFPPGEASTNVLPATTITYANKPAPMPKTRNTSSQSRHPQPPPPSSSFGPLGVPNMSTGNLYNSNAGGSSSFGYDNVYVKDAGSMPLMIGSSNYYNNASQHGGSSLPPPGFKPSVLPPPTTTNEPNLHVGSNPLGEIRATAREFVPSSFAPPHGSAPSTMDFNIVPSMSCQPSTVSHPPPITGSTSNDVSSLLDPMSSLLNSLGNEANLPPGAIPAPATKSESPVQSATSSITGFSGMAEETTTSRVGSALTFESAVGGIQTSSILESISYSGAQESGIGGLGTGGIWGDSTTNQGNFGGLVGLNFSSFLGGEQKNYAQSSNNQSTTNNSNTWGIGTGGSIW